MSTTTIPTTPAAAAIIAAAESVGARPPTEPDETDAEHVARTGHSREVMAAVLDAENPADVDLP